MRKCDRSVPAKQNISDGKLHREFCEPCSPSTFVPLKMIEGKKPTVGIGSFAYSMQHDSSKLQYFMFLDDSQKCSNEVDPVLLNLHVLCRYGASCHLIFSGWFSWFSQFSTGVIAKTTKIHIYWFSS